MAGRPPTSALPPRPRRRPRPPPYVPPFRQRRLDAARVPTSTTDETAQRRAWTRMKKRINGVVNRVNAHNVAHCAFHLLRVNIVRGRGVLCKALLRAQLASPALSNVFAALVAVIGSRFPVIAELLVHRLIAQLKSAYTNQDRVLCFSTARFFAHLFNQQLVNELLLLEFLSTCMLDPSDGSVELAVVTLRDCALLLSEKSPRALELMFQRLREILHEGDLGKRAQVMIENLMHMRRTKFSGADVLEPQLDLLDEEDIITHFASLEEDDQFDLQYECDEFQFDPSYEANENEYETIKKDILGALLAEDPSLNLASGVPPDSSAAQDERGPVEVDTSANGKRVAEKPVDMTEAELVEFRRTVYLTLSSGVSYEEWAHKLIKLMSKNKGRELELCRMIVESCSQEKTFSRTYGLLGQRFCLLNEIYASKFEELFATHYATIHRFDTRKIRNIANFFASLLASDTLPWTLFQIVRIVEEETTASSRIFLKILFQEMANTLGLSRTKQRFKAAEEDGHLKGVMPTDHATNARFAINFFTSIGLGYLTDDLREKLKTLPNEVPQAQDDDDSSSLSSSSLSSSSLSSSSLSPSSDEEAGKSRNPLEANSHLSKRPQEQTSPADHERPSKMRRRSADSEDAQRERDAVLNGREVSVRGSPHTPSHERGGLSYSDVEKNHRAYVNASSGSGAKRVAQRPAEDDHDASPSLHKRRRYEFPDPRERRYEERKSSSKYGRERHRDRDTSDNESYKATAKRDRRRSSPDHRVDDRRRHSLDRRERSRRSPRYSPSPSGGRASRGADSSGGDLFDKEPRRRRYRVGGESASESSDGRHRRSRSPSYKHEYRSWSRRDPSPDLSDDRLSLRSRSRSPARHYRHGYDKRERSNSSYDSEDDGYRLRRSRQYEEDKSHRERRRGFSPPSVRRSSREREIPREVS